MTKIPKLPIIISAVFIIALGVVIATTIALRKEIIHKETRQLAGKFKNRTGATFVGSETCKACHEYEYEKWSTKKHAHAFATLEKVGSDYDPECVDCHVVGMQYEEGFISPKKTPHFKDVGCEVCHGPGSKHIGNPVAVKPSDPRHECSDCHTPEHSGEFEKKHEWYSKQIVHWKEPNSLSSVE